MIELEQTLQDLHIDERDTAVGTTWHNMTVAEIENIKSIFLKAGFTPPDAPADYKTGSEFYDDFKARLTSYVGSALQTNEFDSIVFDELLHLARVAAGIDPM
jgi:hypothetical protein